MTFEKASPDFSRVLRFFTEICAVPRPSYKTAQIADYLCDFAMRRGLFFLRDASDNVMIKKAASKGAENAPALLLQAHTDMVLVREEGAVSDPDAPIRLKTEGDFLTAEGSSLGADDGIGMAYILAVLDDDSLCHPPIEALFTANEEVGLLGAAALDAKWLSARMLINLDSDEEGIFTAGCAGGSNATLTIPLKKEDARDCFTLTLSGLPGGHSGTEIHKGIANASLLLLSFIKEIAKEHPVFLSSVSGGEASNAIPSFAEAVLSCETDRDALLCAAEAFLKKQSEDIGCASFKAVDCGGQPCLSAAYGEALIDFILGLPRGVLSTEAQLQGMPKTSLNLGKIEERDGALTLLYALRSSENGEREDLERDLIQRTARFGGKTCIDGEYPAWPFLPHSPLREACLSVYKGRYGKDGAVAVIHAGLECGILAEKIAGLDAISFGPDNRAIHTVSEALSLSSAAEVYGYLCELIAALTAQRA